MIINSFSPYYLIKILFISIIAGILFSANHLIIIGYDNQYYFISCGNRIENKYVDVITNKLIKLQNMSKDEIKRYYIEQRNNLVEQEGSKGAGLGFIEMAKKSTKALEFDFQKIDENFSYFSITSFI